ncbi:glycosyltransferase [Akkermansiaceae bacterium]|nr:glycosyltransferase [Akkermansiaceae bacterium]
MKVAIVNATDGGGGAGIAGWNLHRGLLQAGVESRLIVDKPTKSESEHVYSLSRKETLPARILNKASWKLGLTGLSTIHSYSLLDHPQVADADVINLHLIGGVHFNYLAVAKLAKKKKVVLTLHDMWNFTGHCVYSFDCRRWKTGCGSCPYPETFPAIQRDGTAWEWKLKKWAFSRKNVSVIAISSWIESMLKESLLKDLPVARIPNGIDLSHYHPIDRKAAKASLGIPEGRTVILFIAADMADKRKGADLLVEAINGLPEIGRKRILLLVVGKPDELILSKALFSHKSLGFLVSDAEKRLAFNVADLTAVPSRIDNLPVVIQESLACGTPVIANKVGGIGDLIVDRETGYLSTDSLVESLNIAVTAVESDDAGQMRDRCHAVAADTFTVSLQGSRYRDYFRTL